MDILSLVVAFVIFVLIIKITGKIIKALFFIICLALLFSAIGCSANKVEYMDNDEIFVYDTCLSDSYKIVD